MAIIIPLRITTALVGLIIGYYAGVIVEWKMKYNSTVVNLANTLSTIQGVSSRLAEYYTSDDDVDNGLFIDFDPTASSCADDTEYSGEEE